jgi:diguanylate cyclase (GGDEF)-like protein
MIAAMAVVAAGVHWFGVLPIDHSGASWPTAAAVVVAAGFLAAEVNTVHIRMGREAYAFSLMEFPLVLGLFFVRPDLLVVCRLAGTVLAFLWTRRPLQKALFNCALFALETSVAVVVWHLIADPADRLSPLAWLATGVTVLLTSLLGSAAVTTVITIASGKRPTSLSEVFGIGQVGDLANACFALVAVYILSVDWRAGWLLGVVIAVIVVAYRSSERARARSESLAQVNRFTEVVGREQDLEAVVGTVLREVGAAFDVASVQLRFVDTDGSVHDWVLDGEEPQARTAALADVVPDTGDGPVLLPRDAIPSGYAHVLRDHGVRDCLQVPLRFEAGAVGSLVVANMLGDVETFRPADVGRLQALGNHAAVAIENAVRAGTIARQAAEREHRALHDELTGLANRRLFGTRLEQSLLAGPSAVLLLDLDRFKDVNDTLGHETGDRLLAQVADRLRSVVLATSLVARIGGDEFAVLLEDAGADVALTTAALVRDSLTRPFDLDGVAVAVDASVGVAVSEPGVEGVNLLRAADVAMYVAKQNRSGLELFRPELDRGDSTRLGLLADLRTTIATAGIDVVYQPKVDVRTGAMTGVEALARWRHPEHGHVGPDEFIPLAEHSSLITPLTMHVLRRALDACQGWRRTAADFTVAVNISPRSLLHDGFVDDVARELARVAVPASALTLEITETSLMADPDRAVAALGRLKDLGVRLSVDDLGTGYSSLAYLQRLPVDEVKIDKSFLRDLRDPSTEAVVGAIVDLGHRLGRHVVAEGVEDAWAWDRLRDLDCDSAQGFWMARPMPADDLSDLLTSWSGPRTTRLRQVHPAG